MDNALTSLGEAGADLDDLTRQAVAIARSSGLSWSTIGDALGVTKQAAHHKYGRA